jgi:hypothetical protein
MSAGGFRDIVTDGLVFQVDAANKLCGNVTNAKNIVNPTETGSLINGVTFADNTWVLDGTNDYILASNDGTGTFDLQEYTIDIWFKPTFNGNYETVWSYDFTSHAPPYYAQHIRIDTPIEVNGPRVIYSVNHSSVSYTIIGKPVPDIPDQTWINIVATKTQTESNLYLNGTLEGSGSYATSTVDYFNQEVYLGAANFATGFASGNYGSVKFYNKALTQKEILQNYNTSKHRFGIK